MLFGCCCFGVGREESAQNHDTETAEATPPAKRRQEEGERRRAGQFIRNSTDRCVGVQNSTGKYAPDAPVCVNELPFDERLERALRAEEEANVRRTLNF
jgi:hypothetical protein